MGLTKKDEKYPTHSAPESDREMVENGADSTKAEIAIVCATDDGYAMPLAVTLHTSLENVSPDAIVYIYVIDGGLSAASKERLERVVAKFGSRAELGFKSPIGAERLSGFKTHGWITQATYYKLLAPSAVPERFDKVISLDCDLLVRRDLQGLWDEKLFDYALLASRDFGTPYVSSPGGIQKHKELGIKPDAAYLNAGVLLLNLKRWRDDSIAEKIIDYLNAYSEYVNVVEQDGINAVLVRDWGELDQRWNVMSHLLHLEEWPDSPFKEFMRGERSELLKTAFIHHFAGGAKPWQVTCEHPARAAWLRALWRSGWFNPAERVAWFCRWYAQYPLWVTKVLTRELFALCGLGTLWQRMRRFCGRIQ